MQVIPSSHHRQNLYPISVADKRWNFSVLREYSKSGVAAIENRYDKLLPEDDPTHFLHELEARDYLKNHEEESAAYRLGVVAARVVINHKLNRFNTDITKIKLPAEHESPIDFARHKLQRFILAPLYPTNRSIDIKADVHAAVGHIIPNPQPGANDWLAVGMGDTHALYGKLWNPHKEFETEGLILTDPVLNDVGQY